VLVKSGQGTIGLVSAGWPAPTSGAPWSWPQGGRGFRLRDHLNRQGIQGVKRASFSTRHQNRSPHLLYPSITQAKQTKRAKIKCTEACPH